MTWSTLATIIAAALVPGAAGKSAIMAAGLGGAQQMAITYTREYEEEADALGAINADRAGYSGLGTAEFLKKLRATSDNKMVPRYFYPPLPWRKNCQNRERVEGKQGQGAPHFSFCHSEDTQALFTASRAGH